MKSKAPQCHDNCGAWSRAAEPPGGC